MIGKSISQYQILEKLGEGGMGVVYKAEDTKLNRTVALKFLPPEMTRDPQAKKRFLQEAQAAAALDHPNICTIHEINEAEGQTYIAMAYVEGKSLKEKLAAGPLEVSEVLDIAAQVAEGLKRAHGKGIIHRDIKPANIMLTEEDRAKIMDFGLAKLTSGPDVTKTLTVMGTIAYMSPEQARGEAVDQRTDIWSFGAMLYEMLTGQTPFGRRQDQAALDSILPEVPALLHSILYDPIDPPSLLRKDLPRPVEQIILKALDKDRNRRYQRMDELLKDLKTARSPELIFPKPEKSIIVLPFENISPDPEQEYFCNGMTEEIIADLSKIHSLRVISRTSAMMLKGTKKDVQTIARELSVQYVLEGSVRKAGNNLRITAQLIDGLNDAHLWAEKYSGTLDDIFDIQEKVSYSIAKTLKVTLGSDEEKKISERPIDNIQAYDLYLKAIHELGHFTGEGAKRALKLLEGALGLFESNVYIYAAMAEAYFVLSHTFHHDFVKHMNKVEEYAKKILELDPHSAHGYCYLALSLWKEPKILDSLKHFKRAFDIDPNNITNLRWLSFCASEIGQPLLAEPCLKKLLEIDPLDAFSQFSLGWYHLMAGRPESALPSLKKAYEMAPDSPIWGFKYARSLALNHQLDEACSLFDRIAKESPREVFGKFSLFYKYALLGERAKALEYLTKELAEAIRMDETLSFYMAEAYALINIKYEAVNWLEHAVWRGVINFPYLSQYDPFLENIRGEERFQKLMERVKKAWEEFEV